MAHRTAKSGYDNLVERLNRAPQGAPPSRLLNRILAMLMNEREASLLSLLPIKPFTVEKAAKVWNLPAARAQAIEGAALDEVGSFFDLERDSFKKVLKRFEWTLFSLVDDLPDAAAAEIADLAKAGPED